MRRCWVAGMVILGVVAGCSGGPTAEAPADTLVIALSDEPDNLNPIFGDLYGSIYGDHWPIFSSLLDYGEDVELEPTSPQRCPRSAATAARSRCRCATT